MNFDTYRRKLNDALDSIDQNSHKAMVDALSKAALNNKKVLVFGNGGSASTSDHFACDHSKGIITDTYFLPNIISLSSNMALFSAIANDIGYDYVFSHQLRHFKDGEDHIALAISASGNSENVINGLMQAKKMHMKTIGLVGFNGGKMMSEGLCDILIHVKSNNYGVVEDCHSIIMHTTSQEIRTSFTKPNHVPKL